MRGQGHQIFADHLARFAAGTADQRVKAIAERAGEPLRVAVRGRRGVGCSTVTCALDRAGISSGSTVIPPEPAGDQDAEVVVYVIAEVVKPEDRDAIAATQQPVVAVLNKADLAGPLSGSGPIAAARTRCALFSALVGVPVEPMIGLLSVAALDDPDGRFGADSGEDLWAALRVLAVHPGGPTCLDGSFDGFLAADLPVPRELRLRLLDNLDLFGIAVGMAAVAHGGPAGTTAHLRALLRRVSGVDAVVDMLSAAGAEVRYRRVLEAVGELEALAVSREQMREQIGSFLRGDEIVVARMAAAVDVARASGSAAELEPEPEPGVSDDPAAHLARAVRWQRYSLARGSANRSSRLGPVSDLHRACGADIARGSLRLWSLAGGVPLGAGGESP